MHEVDPVDAAREVLRLLGNAGRTLATAESLTGGLLGATITAVPGSSTVYLGGVVSYATRIKQEILAVPDDVIDTHGVVSRECAVAMAHGVRRLLGADRGMSTTGVAGPGEQDGVAAGTVWIAVAGPNGVVAQMLQIRGSRDEVRIRTCRQALTLLADSHELM